MTPFRAGVPSLPRPIKECLELRVTSAILLTNPASQFDRELALLKVAAAC